ncbi:nitrogen fixation/metabolism regulation signal transduction histidine kinase [Flavobacterium nitrogenifigens]|uniref:histidine kinase n=2 Tax=Flavobacterium TaxID=237 RepID=A0A7W7IVC5_9FLAO|nr:MULTISPECIES: HAMP domain-containing sensor histidine kinase [Flavobacterium]MBB4800535.1 nitrogen fixation/metabolism regulation signal transduction histidine kinase [Flavobacterium nitrogenifigens]MBB6385715.1 nitrogen fixation/metabolism regulation signal transduction histidine kinase [Flavobacterium notoginsengisoli]
MKNWKFYNALFVRVLSIMLLFFGSAFLFYFGFRYNAILVGAFVLIFLFEMYFFIKNQLSFYDKTINSILHNDFSTHFPEEHKKGDFTSLYNLYDALKVQKQEQTSKELIYSSILNSIDTAALILEKENDTWSIFIMNDCFSNLFKVPKVTHWKYLKNYLPGLCNEIENIGFAEVKNAISIKIEEQDLQTFMLQTSYTQTYDKEYFIILLDSIQRVIEKKEKEAWINLMKIISHELMNSLTPIRALSQNLLHIVDQEELEEDDFEDIKSSISTIINRSDHLQFFVENYRKLAMLPTPNKQMTPINALFEDCLRIMSPILKQEGIELINEIHSSRSISIDKNQMEQVIINLITNSIHALKEKEEKKLIVSSYTENNRFFIVISDNGKGVDAEIRDKVFLPFFTTRKDGAGIGLTLSKNIIEAHGGYLSYQTDEDKTSFVICLI